MGKGDGNGSYYAVIFTSRRTEGDGGYGDMAERMVEMASRQPGFLGIDSARGADGVGITVSYWRTLEDIRAWKAVAAHIEAQTLGRTQWYSQYRVRVARIEYEYGFENELEDEERVRATGTSDEPRA